MPGGRPKGSKNKRTLLQEEHRANGELPVDFMLRLMRDKTLQTNVRLDCAKAVAPYVHPRLNAVEHTGEDGGPLQVIFDQRDQDI
jgi:hypothetical protein